MPDASGNIKGIFVQRVPWHDSRRDLKPYAPPLTDSPKTEGEWVEQYEAWREARGYADKR